MLYIWHLYNGTETGRYPSLQGLRMRNMGELGIDSGSELTVLVSRAPIFSEVGWSEQTGALPGWRHHLVSA